MRYDRARDKLVVSHVIHRDRREIISNRTQKRIAAAGIRTLRSSSTSYVISKDSGNIVETTLVSEAMKSLLRGIYTERSHGDITCSRHNNFKLTKHERYRHM